LIPLSNVTVALPFPMMSLVTVPVQVPIYGSRTGSGADGLPDFEQVATTMATARTQM